MLTNEDLLAISDLIDRKLGSIKAENAVYQDQMMEKAEEIEKRTKDIQGHIKTNVDPAIRRIQLTLENDITPRMKTIESCYTDTFDRYVVSIGEIEGMKTDIEIMKKL